MIEGIRRIHFLLNRRLCAISQQGSPGIQIGTAHSVHFQTVLLPRILLGSFEVALEGNRTSSKAPLDSLKTDP